MAEEKKKKESEKVVDVAHQSWRLSVNQCFFYAILHTALDRTALRSLCVTMVSFTLCLQVMRGQQICREGGGENLVAGFSLWLARLGAEWWLKQTSRWFPL